ncbi:LOW QUALITY PROTEIN: hypothetical protein U9M48_012280, partial [Paspalum notatum var. saurae]
MNCSAGTPSRSILRKNSRASSSLPFWMYPATIVLHANFTSPTNCDQRSKIDRAASISPHLQYMSMREQRTMASSSNAATTTDPWSCCPRSCNESIPAKANAMEYLLNATPVRAIRRRRSNASAAHPFRISPLMIVFQLETSRSGDSSNSCTAPRTSPSCRHVLMTMFQETASFSAITPNARLASLRSPHLAYMSRTALQSTTSGSTPVRRTHPWTRLPDSKSPSPAQHRRTPARTKALGAAALPPPSISANARMPSAYLPPRAQLEMSAGARGRGRSPAEEGNAQVGGGESSAAAAACLAARAIRERASLRFPGRTKGKAAFAAAPASDSRCTSAAHSRPPPSRRLGLVEGIGSGSGKRRDGRGAEKCAA